MAKGTWLLLERRGERLSGNCSGHRKTPCHLVFLVVMVWSRRRARSKVMPEPGLEHRPI